MAIILIVAGVFTFTDRFMPRFKPAKTERFQTLSPHLATHTMGEEEEVYGVGDIGPDFPPEHEIAPVYGVGDIGPDFPPEQLQITTDKKDE